MTSAFFLEGSHKGRGLISTSFCMNNFRNVEALIYLKTGHI